MDRYAKPDAPNQAVTYLRIRSKLSSTRWTTAREVFRCLSAEGVGISILAVQRALKFMRREAIFGVECDDRSKPFGYRLKSQSPFDMDRLCPAESLILVMAHKMLHYLLPSTLMLSAQPLFEGAESSLDSEMAIAAREWKSKVAVQPNQLPFIPPLILTRIFSAVTEALYYNKVLSLVYSSMSAPDDDRVRRVEPLGLVQQDVRVYLVCRYEGHKELRHMALHRMRSAEVMDRVFERPKEFSLDSYLAGTHFNYTKGGLGMIHLSFEFESPVTWRNLQETPLDVTQQITQIGRSRWRLTAEMPDSKLLDGWLSAWKKDAKIKKIKKERICNRGAAQWAEPFSASPAQRRRL